MFKPHFLVSGLNLQFFRFIVDSVSLVSILFLFWLFGIGENSFAHEKENRTVLTVEFEMAGIPGLRIVANCSKLRREID